jgi:hypothetical protein
MSEENPVYTKDNALLEAMTFKFDKNPDPESAMREFQRLRMEMIGAEIADGIPTIATNKSKAYFVSRLLADGEIAAAASMRATVDKKNGDSAADIAKAAAELVKQFSTAAQVRDVIPGSNRAVRVDDSDKLPSIELVPNHTFIGTEFIDHETL